MNTVRSIAFVIWLYGALVLMGLIWLPSLLLPRRVLKLGIVLYTKIIRLGLRMICGIRTELRGRENIPSGPILIASKHQCMWDVFIPFLLVDDPAIIMKRELAWYPFLGWFALAMRMIPIDRGGTIKTLKKMVAIARIRSSQGRQVLIFPEGTRKSPGDKPAYFAAGVFLLYRELGVPCLPIATNSGLCWPAHGYRRNAGVAVYEALSVIPAGLAKKEFMEELESRIENSSNLLLDEGRRVNSNQS